MPKLVAWSGGGGHFAPFYINQNKKDGYRQRNVRQFLHILASLGTPVVQSR